jgi:hypothetical protein
LDRLIAAYLNTAQDGVATVEGSFTSDTLAANAVEFEKAYGVSWCWKLPLRKHHGVNI